MSFLGNIVSGVTKAVTDPGALISNAAKAVLPKNMAAVGDILGGIADIESGHPLQALSHLTDALKDLPQLMQSLSSGAGGSSAAQPAGTAAAEPSPPPKQSPSASTSGTDASTPASATPGSTAASTTPSSAGSTPGATTGTSEATSPAPAPTPPASITTPSQTETATSTGSARPITPLDIFLTSTGPSVQTSGTPGNRTIMINEGAGDGNRTITIQEKAGQPPKITVTPKPAPGSGPAVTVSRGTNGQQTITVNDSRLGGGKSITYQENPGQPPTLSTTGFPAPWQSIIAALAAKLPSQGGGTTSEPPGSLTVPSSMPAPSAGSSASASATSTSGTEATSGTGAAATSTSAASSNSTSSSSTASSASTPAPASGTSSSASSAAAPKDLAGLMAMSPDQFMQAVTSGKIPDSVANSQSAMMQVQARMNQITQMNQLVTGMMAAMHQMEMSIIQNIRC